MVIERKTLERIEKEGVRINCPDIDPELLRKMLTSHTRKCHAENDEMMSTVSI